MASLATWTSDKGIPVRNLWFLLVHASGLARMLDRAQSGVDGDAEVPDLLAILLAEAVERRLRRGLSRGYVGQTAALSRVRGRIDWLATESRQELLRGRITCRFQDLTFDRARNRFARAALRALADRVARHDLRTRVRDLDRSLEAWGVGAERPSSAALLADMPTMRETDDRLMVESARLALDLVLPSEVEGHGAVTRLARDEHLLRRIFEGGVAGYLRHHLDRRDGWSVRPQRSLTWQIKEATPGLGAILPGMVADIVLERGVRRIVVDTKFTTMLTRNRYDREVLKNAHIYQLYTYLRTQEGHSSLADNAEGLLLYPALGSEQSESVLIDGHRLRFASINLSQPSPDLGEKIKAIVCG